MEIEKLEGAPKAVAMRQAEVESVLDSAVLLEQIAVSLDAISQVLP